MRARNIKPSFFTNEYLTSLDPLVRLLFIGLWCMADREGRLEDRPRRIKIGVLPCEDCDVDRMLEDLALPQGPDGERFIRRYEVDGRRCIQVLNFVRHQNPHIREAASVLPAPPAETNVAQRTSPLSDLHRKSTVPATEEVQASPADSLIPESLIPDSPLLIPDPPILITSIAEIPVEDLRLDGFHSTKQIENLKATNNRHGLQANRYESPNLSVYPGASPPNEDVIEVQTASLLPVKQENLSPTAVLAMIVPSLTDNSPMIDQSLANDPTRINRSLTNDPTMIDRSLTDDPTRINRSLPNDRSKKVLDDSLIPDSPLLIPDPPSLIPDSPLLIPDPPSLIPDFPLRIASAEKPSTERGVGDGFISPRPSKNPQPISTGKEETGMVRVGDLIRARFESPPARQPPLAKRACDEECDQIYPPEFEQFWQQYPRQIEKKRAFQAWQARIKDKVDAGDLIRAAQHYAAHCRRRRTDPEYIKHPSTFLGPLEVYRDWVATLYKAGRSRNDWRPDYEEDLNLLSF